MAGKKDKFENVGRLARYLAENLPCERVEELSRTERRVHLKLRGVPAGYKRDDIMKSVNRFYASEDWAPDSDGCSETYRIYEKDGIRHLVDATGGGGIALVDVMVPLR